MKSFFKSLISRFELKINWNTTTPDGIQVIDERVSILLNLELNQTNYDEIEYWKFTAKSLSINIIDRKSDGFFWLDYF